MRRFVVALLVLASITVVRPATAGDGPCVGLGSMWTSAPITNVGFGPMMTVSWAASLDIGACATVQDGLVSSFSATGVYTGWCDLSTGYGVTSEGHRFAWVGVGNRHFYTGEFTGEIPFMPNVLSGDSCYTGADNFILGYSGGVLWHCKVTSTSGTLTTVPDLPVHYHLCA